MLLWVPKSSCKHLSPLVKLFLCLLISFPHWCKRNSSPPYFAWCTEQSYVTLVLFSDVMERCKRRVLGWCTGLFRSLASLNECAKAPLYFFLSIKNNTNMSQQLVWFCTTIRDKVWLPIFRNPLGCKRTRGWHMSNRDVFKILLNRQGKNFLLFTKVILLIFFLKQKVFSEAAMSWNFKED